MKVLEKGPGWSLKIKCTGAGNGGAGCDSILLIEEGDVYMTHSYCYDGSSDSYYTIYCPLCGAETDIPGNKLPSRIKDLASNRTKASVIKLCREAYKNN